MKYSSLLIILMLLAFACQKRESGYIDKDSSKAQQKNKVSQLPTSLFLQGLQRSRSEEGLDLRGKAFNLRLNFNYQTGDSGPLFTFYEQDAYGMSLYIKNDQLYLGIRTQGQDEIFLIPHVLSSGKLSFKIELEAGGSLSFYLFDGLIESFETIWPLPKEKRAESYKPGAWASGQTASPWIEPIGAYGAEEIYSGMQEGLSLQLKLR